MHKVQEQKNDQWTCTFIYKQKLNSRELLFSLKVIHKYHLSETSQQENSWKQNTMWYFHSTFCSIC